jgi:hypothetical protein
MVQHDSLNVGGKSHDPGIQQEPPIFAKLGLTNVAEYRIMAHKAASEGNT